MGQTVLNESKSTAGLEHADGCQDGNTIRYEADSNAESALCPLDERVVDVQTLVPTGANEQHDGPDDEAAGEQTAECLHLCVVHAVHSPEQAAHQCGYDGEHDEESAAKQVNTLRDTDNDETYDGGDHCCQQEWNKYVCGVSGTSFGPVGHDGNGDDGQSRRVEHEEHNHRIGCRVFFRIQFLQLLHGFQAARGGCVVESEHVGRDVHEDAAERRMVLWNFGKELGQDRTKPLRELGDKAAVLADFQDAHP